MSKPPLKPLITQQQGMVRKATIDLTRALKSLKEAHVINGKCEDYEMMTESETKIVINAVSNMEYTLSTIRKI